MTDLTPEQRATQIRKLVFDWINLDQKDFPWPALDSKIAAEIRAAEQAAREKALRAAVNAICPLHHTGMPFDEVKQIHIGQAGSYACSAINILRLLEEKND